MHTISSSGFSLILRLGCPVFPPFPLSPTYLIKVLMREGAVFIGAGLLYLRYSPSQSEIWAAERTDYHAWWPCTLAFCISSVFLLFAPFIPNEIGGKSLLTKSIPYFVFPTVGCCVLAAGFVYWFGFAKIWPKIGFTLEVERTEDEFGHEVIKYKVGLALTLYRARWLTLWNSMSRDKGKHVPRHRALPLCLNFERAFLQTRGRCRR